MMPPQYARPTGVWTAALNVLDTGLNGWPESKFQRGKSCVTVSTCFGANAIRFGSSVGDSH